MYQKSMSTVKTTKGKQDTCRYKLTNINGITSMKIVLNFLYFTVDGNFSFSHKHFIFLSLLLLNPRTPIYKAKNSAGEE